MAWQMSALFSDRALERLSPADKNLVERLKQTYPPDVLADLFSDVPMSHSRKTSLSYRSSGSKSSRARSSTTTSLSSTGWMQLTSERPLSRATDVSSYSSEQRSGRDSSGEHATHASSSVTDQKIASPFADTPELAELPMQCDMITPLSPRSIPVLEFSRPLNSSQPKEFICTWCGESFRDAFNWENHEEDSHEVQFYWPCPDLQCDEVFIDADRFEEHHQIVHGCQHCAHASQVVRPLPAKKMWGCGFTGCKQHFDSWDKRCKHVALHYEYAAARAQTDISRRQWEYSVMIRNLLRQPATDQAFKTYMVRCHGTSKRNWPNMEWRLADSADLRRKLEYCDFSSGVQDIVRLAYKMGHPTSSVVLAATSLEFGPSASSRPASSITSADSSAESKAALSPFSIASTFAVQTPKSPEAPSLRLAASPGASSTMTRFSDREEPLSPFRPRSRTLPTSSGPHAWTRDREGYSTPLPKVDSAQDLKLTLPVPNPQIYRESHVSEFEVGILIDEFPTPPCVSTTPEIVDHPKGAISDDSYMTPRKAPEPPTRPRTSHAFERNLNRVPGTSRMRSNSVQTKIAQEPPPLPSLNLAHPMTPLPPVPSLPASTTTDSVKRTKGPNFIDHARHLVGRGAARSSSVPAKPAARLRLMPAATEIPLPSVSHSRQPSLSSTSPPRRAMKRNQSTNDLNLRSVPTSRRPSVADTTTPPTRPSEPVGNTRARSVSRHRPIITAQHSADNTLPISTVNGITYGRPFHTAHNSISIPPTSILAVGGTPPPPPPATAPSASPPSSLVKKGSVLRARTERSLVRAGRIQRDENGNEIDEPPCEGGVLDDLKEEGDDRADALLMGRYGVAGGVGGGGRVRRDLMSLAEFLKEELPPGIIG